MDRENKDDAKFFDLLKSMAGIQLGLIKVNVAKTMIEQKEFADNVTNNLKKSMIEKANKFGRDVSEGSSTLKEIDEIIKEYKKEFDIVGEAYDSQIALQSAMIADKQIEMQSVMERRYQNNSKKENYKEEFKKRKADIEKEITSAIESGDSKTFNSKVEEYNQYIGHLKLNEYDQVDAFYKSELENMQKAIDESKKYIDVLRDLKMTELGKLFESRNKALSDVKELNFIQKTLGGILNRINGGKKFVNEALDPAKNKLDEIKAKVPKIFKAVQSKSLDVRENIEDAVKMIPDKARDASTRAIQPIQSRMNDAAGFVNDAINKAKEKGMDVSVKAVDVVKNAKEYAAYNATKGVVYSIYFVDKVKNFAAPGIVTAMNFSKDAALYGIEVARGTGRAVGDLVMDNIEDAKDTFGRARDYAGEKVMDAKDFVYDMTDVAKEKITNGGRVVKNTISNVGKVSRDVANKSVKTVRDFSGNVVKNGKALFLSVINQTKQAQESVIRKMESKNARDKEILMQKQLENQKRRNKDTEIDKE